MARFLVILFAALLALGLPAAAVNEDLGPPVTLVEPGGIEGTNGWWVSDVTVALTCLEDVECHGTEFSIDGSELAAYEDPFAVAGDGIHTVLARSTDTAANIEELNELLVRIDTVAPDGALAEPAPGKAYVNDMLVDLPADLPYTVIVGDKTVRADAADATSGVDRVEFSIDGELRSVDAEAPYDWLWHAGDENAGGHVVEIAIFDVAGNSALDKQAVVTVPTSDVGVLETVG